MRTGRSIPTGGAGAGRRQRRPRGGRVPSAYRNAPVKDRLAVVQGLMDAGGQPAGSAAVYRSAAGQQADDLAWLVRSLGGRAELHPVQDGAYDVP